MTKRQKLHLADLHALLAQNDRDRAALDKKRQNIMAEFDALLAEVQIANKVIPLRRVS